MPKITDFPPRVKQGKLRVFANAEEARAYDWKHPRRGTIAVVSEWGPHLRWYLPRPLPTRREKRLRDFLDQRTVCAFGLVPHGGIAWGFPQHAMTIGMVASTICAITGARL